MIKDLIAGRRRLAMQGPGSGAAGTGRKRGRRQRGKARATGATQEEVDAAAPPVTSSSDLESDMGGGQQGVVQGDADDALALLTLRVPSMWLFGMVRGCLAWRGAGGGRVKGLSDIKNSYIIKTQL